MIAKHLKQLYGLPASITVAVMLYRNCPKVHVANLKRSKLRIVPAGPPGHHVHLMDCFNRQDYEAFQAFANISEAF